MCKNLLLAVATLFASLAAAQHFERVTEGAFVNDPADSRAVNWIDMDGDGDLDLFVTNGSEGGRDNMLYRNEGGTFIRITEDPIVNDGAPSDGASWADIDNDGDLDCFVANWYGVNNLLYRNQGNGSFALESGSPVASDHGYSESGSWADDDGDGWIDLVVANSDGSNHTNFHYRNQGDGSFVRFTEGPIAAGSAGSRAPLWADYDNDGDPDLYVANEANQNDFLYRNDGGVFTQLTDNPLTTSGGSTATASWGDYDNDGDLDLFAGNFGTSGSNCNANDFLFRNDDGLFTRITDSEVATQGGCSFGSLWADLDNDADLDLFVTNGFRNAGNVNFLFWNQGDGTFLRDGSAPVATDSGWSYGAAAGDVDRDGDLDLFVARWTPPETTNAFYRNLAHANGNHYLVMRLVGTASNRAAIGARVRIKATVNGVQSWQMREVAGQSGYCGQTLEQHFGLADAASVDSLVIRWPSGLVETYTNLAADQYLTVTEDGGWTGVGRSHEPLPGRYALLQGFPNPFNPSVEIRFELPVAGRAELAIYDLSGKRVISLADEPRAAGAHQIVWNGRDSSGVVVPSGAYFCRLRAGDYHATVKLLKIG